MIDEYWEDDFDIGDDSEDDEREDYEGCLWPDKCVMPGIHLVSECCTAEMMEQMREAKEA